MHVVAGMAAAYGIPQVRNFVKSFKRHVRGELILFLHDVSDETRAWTHAAGAVTADLGTDIPAKFARYIAMRDLLETYPEYTRLYHSDVRDAVAQADIFDQIPEDGLHVFLEDPGISLARCRYNGAWLEQVYGKEVLAQYGDRKISCSGSTLGDRESFLAYADAMTEEFLRLLRELPPERRHLVAHDQALHNHLIYSGILEKRLDSLGKKLFLHDNGDGVLTMGYMKQFAIARHSGAITTPDGGVPAVVHQYDRFTSILEFMDDRYKDNG